MPDARRLTAKAALIAALPACPILFLTRASGSLALDAGLLLPAAVVVAAGPALGAGWGRLRGLMAIGPALAAVIAGSFAALGIAIVSLCSSGEDGQAYLTTTGAWLTAASFALPYLLGSVWAVGRPSRTAWAWPLVIAVSFAAGLAVLALVEGGSHYCYT